MRKNSLAGLVSLSLFSQLLWAAPAPTAETDKTGLSSLPVSPTMDGRAEPSATQKQFDKTVDEYFESCFKDDPIWATDAGFHQWDGNLADYSAEGRTKRIAALEGFLNKFENVNSTELDKFARLDREMLLSHINAQLHELQSIRGWERNPDLYSSHINSAVFALIKRKFASPEERLRSVIAREKQAPAVLAAARANLKNPPRIYTQIALEQLPGMISFFEKAVPEAFSSVSDAQLKTEFQQANAKTIEELKSYQTFLKTEMLANSRGEFAIGKDNYAKKLLYEEMVDENVDSLLQKGYDELHRLQKQFVDVAKQIDPNKTPQQVFATISLDHPRPTELQNSVTGVLSQLRDICRDKDIITIPNEEDLKVEEMPPFMRALAFAAMDTPGPFETTAKEAYYYVTLPQKNWTSKRTEEHMRFFGKPDLITTSVHEAYPGHYVQGLWMRLAPSKTRKLLWCGTNSEGWAHYCEEMMTDKALDVSDKKLKLAQLHDALLRACRYIVGIRMHTQGMTLNEAIAFFMKEGYQEKTNAERESKRGTMDPTYLVYTLGKLQILALRDDYEKSRGQKYTLKEFHNNFLAQGCAPIKIVRRALLGQTE